VREVTHDHQVLSGQNGTRRPEEARGEASEDISRYGSSCRTDGGWISATLRTGGASEFDGARRDHSRKTLTDAWLPRAEASREAPETQRASGTRGSQPDAAGKMHRERGQSTGGAVRPCSDGAAAEADAEPLRESAGGGAPIQPGAAAGPRNTAEAFALTPAAPRRTRAQISAEAKTRRELAEQTKALRAAERAAKKAASKVQPAGQEYAEAYALGQRDASGQPFAVPTARQVFWPILRAHATDSEGHPLEGAPLRAWIRASAAEYRRAMAESPFERGYTPQKWGEWLQGGKRPFRGQRAHGRFLQKVADRGPGEELPNLSERLAAAGDI
jgi:hypothetical protein